MRNQVRFISTVFLVLSLVLPAALIVAPVTGADTTYITPDTTGLYGGLIYWIEVIALDDNHSRVFISTQSANSIFYADVDHTQDDPFANIKFQIVPDLDADAGFGTIQTFAVDEASGWLYFAWWPEGDSSLTDDDRDPGIYRVNIQEHSLTYVEFESEDEYGPGIGWVERLMIHDGHLLFIEQKWDEQTQTDTPYLRFATIDATTGALTENTESPISLGESEGGWMKAPVVHPVNDCLYILDCGEHWGDKDIDSVIYKTSDKYDSLSGSTTFSKIVPPKGSSQSPRQYEALGIGPDGVLFLAGWQQTDNGHHESVVIFSDDDGATWTTGTRDEYCWAWQGPNFAFLDDGSGGYDIVCGTMVSDDSGATWGMLPRTGNVWPHPGSIAFDPNGDETFYVRTDRGIAVTTDGGYSFSKAWTRAEDVDLSDIEVIDLGDNKSRIFIREHKWGDSGQADEPDKIYYADIDHSTDPPTYGDFEAVPTMGGSSDWEIWSEFAADDTSHAIFFEGTPDRDDHQESGLYRTDGTTAPAKVTIESGYASRPLIHDGSMFFVDSSWGGGYWVDGYWVDGYWEDGAEPSWVDGYEDAEGNWVDGYWTEGTWVDGYWVDGYWVEGEAATNLHFGTIDEDGVFTETGEAQIADTEGIWPEKMVIGPDDGCVYILSNDWSTGTKIYKSSDAYDSIGESTTFTEISSPSTTSTSYEWRAFGVGPDGQLYLAGWSTMGENTIAYSENDGNSWETVDIENDWCGIGDEFAFLGTLTAYDAFCGTMVSDDNGANWASLPRKDDTKAHPDSSCAQIDPNNSQVLYMPTSKGIGVSADSGYHFVEINEGVEAVQIKDLVLDPSSGNGWSAAKSGVREVFDFSTNPTWSLPMDPDGEGAWYNVVEMDLSDENGDTAYVGTEWGDRLYKTIDGGEHWTTLWRPQPQFDPGELANDWCWPNWCGSVSDIKVDPYDSDRIFVGYDTGWWGWGENNEERVFGQLWVIEEGSEETSGEMDKWDWGPQQGKDWTQILLYRDEETNKTAIANNEGDHTWYALKGDVNVQDILITQENAETVIYVAAWYSDESATRITDEEKIHNGLYDSYGYPMVYDIYRITGDNESGWNVEGDFGEENTSITTLAVDSAGTVYACGKDYDEDTYNSYVNDYKDKAREEIKEKWRIEQRDNFQDEAHDGFYAELIADLFGEGTGRISNDDWDGHFDEAYGGFYDQYFNDYQGEYGDDFDVFFEESFADYFANTLGPEYDKHSSDGMNEHFDDFWEWNKPQPGLRIVYMKTLGGNWEALTLKGINRAFAMHHHFDYDKMAMTIGVDPWDGTTEVPYVAFNRFIYYLPSDAAEWVLGMEYPAGTEIYVIVGVDYSETSGASLVYGAEEDETSLYVGTGTGLYIQPIRPSDYERSGRGLFGGVSLPVLAGAIASVAIIGGATSLFFGRRILRRSN